MSLINGLYGFKVGMSQIFDQATKQVIPVTALLFKPMVVLRVMPNVGDRCVLGVGVVDGDKPVDGKNGKVFCHLNVDAEVAKSYPVGTTLSLADSRLREGSIVSASGFSKGLGFQGVMRRHGFSGGPKSHGSNFHRKPGCSGSIRSSGKVIRGRKMPGRTGFDMVTVKGLKIVRVDESVGCVFLKGAVPGKKNNLIFVRV